MPNQIQDAAVESPCVSNCALDEEDCCVGCFRTNEEISRWREMSEGEKKQVLINSLERGNKKGGRSGPPLN